MKNKMYYTKKDDRLNLEKKQWMISGLQYGTVV